MKKRTFMNLLLGTVGGLLFSLGLCMCLLPEWDAFRSGTIVTALGGIVLLVLAITAWIRSGKKLIINWKLTGKIVYGTVSALVLGLGMSLVLVGGQLVVGIGLGVAGIVMLLCLIPMCLGFQK